MAEAQLARVRQGAERRAVPAHAAERHGAEHAGVPHKHKQQVKAAVTAAHKQEHVLQIAAGAAAALGEPVRGKHVPQQANLRQAKPAATAEQEQEQFLATVIQAAGQQAHGEHAADRACAQ